MESDGKEGAEEGVAPILFRRSRVEKETTRGGRGSVIFISLCVPSGIECWANQCGLKGA